MAWQDVFPLNVSHIDAEEERELRLAAQARAGAEWALAALVARYQPPVTRYLTRLTGSPETSRLLAERIFVRMEKRLRGPQGGQRLRLWLLRACTEAGLDTLRHPQRSRAALRLDSPRMAGLLPEHAGEVAAGKLRAGLGALATLTGSTSRQVRQLIWSTETGPSRRGSKPAPRSRRETTRPNGRGKSFQVRMPPITAEEDPDQQDPREALRYRMVRAVLAEIPYGDAQCLALHLIAGLNQAEVAQALGITQSATRHRIVQGLQLFAQRYEAAAASLGLSMEALAADTATARTTMPPKIAQTPPPVSAVSAVPFDPPTTAPPPQASLDSPGPASIEEQPAVAWDTPPVEMETAAGAAAEAYEAVEAVESVPPLEPVTGDVVSVAAPEGEVYAGAEGIGTDTLILEEQEEQGEQGVAAPNPDAEKPLVIVETTAVVDAVPVAELPLMDTAVLAAPDRSAAEQAADAADMVALRLAAVAVPSRPLYPLYPPEPIAPEPASPEPLPVAEPEPVAEEVETLASDAPVVELAETRLVPVLTLALSAPIMPAAPASADVADVGRPVRVVPVLTSAAPASEMWEARAETSALAGDVAPAGEPVRPVRVVPVLTPATSVAPAALTEADAAEMAEKLDTTRETVVLAAGGSEEAADAAVEPEYS